MSRPFLYEISPLFEDVQLQKIFPDGKTFVDCVPKYDLEKINQQYLAQKDKTGFDLKDFILSNFEPPVPHSTHYKSDPAKTVEENIELLWNVLTRQPNTRTGAIELTHPYIVPGGRFGEIYYWDSYFTMLGLQASGKTAMVENMVNNFSFLIDTLGYIPNGNRSYFIGRSQPPFFSFMVRMLAEMKDENIIPVYLPQLEREYRFWMKGADDLDKKNGSACHVVLMPGGELLNRYWDENDSPRPEAFREDVELSYQSEHEPSLLYRHLRAGAESGWDFTYRWFKEEDSFASIHTTDIIPVDLNCLLYHLECMIADGYRLKADTTAAEKFLQLAKKRKQAIQTYCWNKEQGFYFDYDFTTQQQKTVLSLAGIYPLFVKIAAPEQADKVAAIVKEKFLQPGGVVSTLKTTGQQWDAPNGWAPLHWTTIIGLENYNHHTLATDIASRWIKLNTDVFKRTGKLMEKYNVVNTSLEAGGGEYPGQDGFGWTNGVLLALMKKYS
jgi:alpha,alpha-trehalase